MGRGNGTGMGREWDGMTRQQSNPMVYAIFSVTGVVLGTVHAVTPGEARQKLRDRGMRQGAREWYLYPIYNLNGAQQFAARQGFNVK